MHVEKKETASESTDSPMSSSDNGHEVALTTRMLFSLKNNHPTLRPPSKAE